MHHEVLALTECGITTEGRELRLSFRTTEGDSTLTLSLEQAGALLMTLPQLIERALRQLHSDASLRYVFPLGDWKLESGGDGPMILNLKTPDGFAVSFAVGREEADGLTAALGENARRAAPVYYRQ